VATFIGEERIFRGRTASPAGLAVLSDNPYAE
jgi:hypothetical protein